MSGGDLEGGRDGTKLKELFYKEETLSQDLAELSAPKIRDFSSSIRDPSVRIQCPAGVARAPQTHVPAPHQSSALCPQTPNDRPRR